MIPGEAGNSPAKNGEGEAVFVPVGHGDQTALAILATSGWAHLGSDSLRFRLEPGAMFQLHGLAKGEGLDAHSQCRLRLEFYSSTVKVYSRNKNFLREELLAQLAWGERENVPVYLGEFGATRDSFLPGRGGLTWVEDMLDLVDTNSVHFAYRAYHETSFGLFDGQGELPQPRALNRPLYDLFVRKLDGTGLRETRVPRPAMVRPEQVEGGTTPKESSIRELD